MFGKSVHDIAAKMNDEKITYGTPETGSASLPLTMNKGKSIEKTHPLKKISYQDYIQKRHKQFNNLVSKWRGPPKQLFVHAKTLRKLQPQV